MIIAIATIMSVAFQIEQFTGENILALVILMVREVLESMLY